MFNYRNRFSDFSRFLNANINLKTYHVLATRVCTACCSVLNSSQTLKFNCTKVKRH